MTFGLQLLNELNVFICLALSQSEIVDQVVDKNWKGHEYVIIWSVEWFQRGSKYASY